MPTTVNRTIGTSRDYSSLQAWSDAAPLNLTTTRTNTCGSGSTTSAIVLDSGANSVTNDFYRSLTITIAGEERLILSYVAATRTATIGSLNGSAATFTSAPSSGAAYTINDVIWKGILYKEGAGTNGEWTLSARVTCYGSNHTTDATRYIWLTTAAGASFTDNANKLTNALAYNTANGVSIRMTGTEKVFELSNGITFRFTGLQIKANTGIAVQAFNAGGLITLENCIVCSNTTTVLTQVPVLRAVNSVFYNTGTVSDFPSTERQYLYNSTFYSTSTSAPLLSTTNGDANVYCCAFFGGNAVASASTFFVGSNNATNQSSVGFGSSNQVSLTTANQFENVTASSEDFRVKAGAALINNGIRQQTYTSDLDIVGSARSITTPTIGAWEYASIPYQTRITWAEAQYQSSGVSPSTDYSEPLSRGIFRGIERGVA
jgi:hypothetical protein